MLAHLISSLEDEVWPYLFEKGQFVFWTRYIYNTHVYLTTGILKIRTDICYFISGSWKKYADASMLVWMNLDFVKSNETLVGTLYTAGILKYILSI